MRKLRDEGEIEGYRTVLEALNEGGITKAKDAMYVKMSATISGVNSRKDANRKVNELLHDLKQAGFEYTRFNGIDVDGAMATITMTEEEIKQEEIESAKSMLRYEVLRRDRTLNDAKQSVDGYLSWMVEKLERAREKLQAAKRPEDYRWIREEICGSIWGDITRGLAAVERIAKELELAHTMMEHVAEIIGEDLLKKEEG